MSSQGKIYLGEGVNCCSFRRCFMKVVVQKSALHSTCTGADKASAIFRSRVVVLPTSSTTAAGMRILTPRLLASCHQPSSSTTVLSPRPKAEGIRIHSGCLPNLGVGNPSFQAFARSHKHLPQRHPADRPSTYRFPQRLSRL